MPDDEDRARLEYLISQLPSVVFEEDTETVAKLREIYQLQRKFGVELVPDTDAALVRAERRALEGTPDYKRMQDILRRIRRIGHRVPQRFLDALNEAEKGCGEINILEVEVDENPPRSPFISEEEWAELLDLDAPA